MTRITSIRARAISIPLDAATALSSRLVIERHYGVVEIESGDNAWSDLPTALQFASIRNWKRAKAGSPCRSGRGSDSNSSRQRSTVTR